MTEILLQRISLDPEICHGKPCIRGLRYSVEFLLELLSSGMTQEEILRDYDDLEKADILAVLVTLMRGKATVEMTTDEILSLTRGNERGMSLATLSLL